MNRRQTAIATFATVLAAGLTPAGVAWAADSGEVQDLKREVSQLRSEIQVLQAALAEATELERQRSVNLVRAVKESANADPADAPAGSVAEPTRPAAPAATAAPADKSRSSSHQHRRRHSPRSRSKVR